MCPPLLWVVNSCSPLKRLDLHLVRAFKPLPLLYIYSETHTNHTEADFWKIFFTSFAACEVFSTCFLFLVIICFFLSSQSAFSTILQYNPFLPSGPHNTLRLPPPCLSVYIKITRCLLQDPVLTAQGCSQACVCLCAYLCMFLCVRGKNRCSRGFRLGFLILATNTPMLLL